MADFFSGLNESALFPALFNVIEMRKKKEEQEKALKALGGFFSKDQATYSPQSFVRPQGDQYGVPRVTQPTTPQSVNFQTVPTVPSPNDWGFISALINAAQAGVPTGPISEAVGGAQPQFEELSPGTMYGERQGTRFTPKGQVPFKPESMAPPEMLLRSEPKTLNGVTKILDTYGYKSPEGEVITKQNYSDFTPPDRSGRNTPEFLQRSMLEKFNADPNVRKQVQSVNASKQIIELLDARNPVADNAIPTFMARASGEVGNLSEADKAPFGGSASLQQKITRTVERAATGNLDDADRQFVKELASVMERSANRNIDAIARLRSKQYSQLNKDFKEEDLYMILSPSGGLGTVKISSNEEYDKLPSGTTFIAPDGTTRVKP